MVVLLFSIPPVLQLLGLFLIKDVQLKFFYSLLSLFSSICYLSPLVYYMIEPKANWYSGWICIVVSFVLVVIAFVLTSATFNDDILSTRIPIVNRITSKIGISPSGEVLIFLAFFISIAYLLSFALAFHDRNRTTQALLPGLIAESIPRSEDVFREASNEPFLQDESRDTNWLLFFPAGSAELQLYEKSVSSSGPNFTSQNNESLNNIVRILSNFGDATSVRVTLIAHSDDSRLAGSEYGSNYELATARANFVKSRLLNRLVGRKNVSWNNIEWLIVPLPESKAKNEDKPANRMVEVIIHPLYSNPSANVDRRSEIRLLTLLEYIYFSVYTITTTGYGDIKPSTPYAMFVCTIANLYEVFFMVVFFNVLISPKTRRLNRRKRPTLSSGENQGRIHNSNDNRTPDELDAGSSKIRND